MELKQKEHQYTRLQKLLGIGLLLGVAGGYVAGYRPMSAELAAANTAIADTRHQIDDGARRTADLTSTRAEVADLERQLRRFRQITPQVDLPGFYDTVSRLADDSALRRFARNPLERIDTKLYREWPVTLKFEGDFVSVYSFLRRLEQMDRLSRLRKLRVETIDEKTGSVRVELTLSLFSSQE